MVRPTLISLNPVEFKCDPFMISLVLSPKTCVPKKTKDINVKELEIITNKNEAKKSDETYFMGL